jgi:hypothetical protein
VLSVVSGCEFSTVTFCCTVFIVVLYLPMFCTVCLQLYCVQTYFTYSVCIVLSPNALLHWVYFIQICFVVALWLVANCGLFFWLSVMYNETGLLENPIKVAFKSDYKWLLVQ